MSPDQSNRETARRKQSRPSRAVGKAGQRAVEAVLEAAGLVVQRVEQDNDIGRDAFVDVVEGGDVTGGVISLQVKSGPSFAHKGNWLLPGDPEDFTLWRESTVPFFGVVHDPASGALRWVDLSTAARISDPYLSPIVKGPFGRNAVPVPDNNRLDLAAEPFIHAAAESVRRFRGLPTAALLSRDPEIVMIGITDVFAVGRHDPDAFLLLGALFHRLPVETRRDALAALAMCTRHPDVYWTRNNWIPETVKAEVRSRTNWTPPDIEAFLGMIDEDGIGRGTIGQDVFHVLEMDRCLADRLFETAVTRQRQDSVRLWAAVILVYQAQVDAPELVARLLRLAPDLAEQEMFAVLVDHLREWGSLDLF